MAKDNKCKACGNDISYADCFCPKCGYEQHIYPEEMSDVVRNQVDNYERLRLEIWNSHKHSPIAHLLMLGNVVNNVYDIYPGTNTFGGSAIEGELNHQIIIKPDVSLKPLHFSIEAIDGKFNFVDHVGDLCLSSSSLKNQVHIQKEGLDLVFIKKM